MWRKPSQLGKIFSVSPAHTTKMCRFIDTHLDRYGKDAVIAKSYSVLAFADACEVYLDINAGKEVPPFDPDRIRPYVAEHLIEDAQDFCEVGIRKTRLALYDAVNIYFHDTKIPKDFQKCAKAIRLAMLSIVMTEEVK